MRPRVLLVDDQAAFRAAARELLEHGGFDVVGEAATAAEALRSERELRPEVVLLDVRLPDGTGLDVAQAMTRAISDHETPPAVVLVSTADYRYAVHECGARGFLLKAELSVEALRAVLAEQA
jgi:DNA-binding NarL/FixJ family response regulator